jgi:PKD repeat protein
MKRTAQNILAKIFVSILIISVFLPILSAFEVITYNDLGNGGWHSLTTDSENGNDFYKADSNWDYHSSDGMHETDDEEGSIYYRFILKDYLIKAGSLKIGVYFWSHAGGLWPWAINGPDLYAYNYKNNEWEMIKQSLGNWDDLDWAWVDCSNDYISSDGKVQFNIFSCYDDSVLIEKVAVKYQMGDEAINSLNITPVDENDDSYPDGFVADVNVDVGLSNDGSKTNVRAIYNLLTPNGDIIDTIQDTWQITSNTVEYHQCSLTALGSINGEYTLNIQLFDSAENKEDDVSVQIDLFPCPPSAGFSVDINGLIVSFNDNTYLCNGYIESWRWEFGDGCTSAEQNPVHKFESEGEFLIALTIIDSFGLSDSVSRKIEVENLHPVCNFDVTVNKNTVSFIDMSMDLDGSIIGYKWDFGDGIYSTEKNPTHTYQTDKSMEEYSIVLTVTDDFGDSSSKTKLIEIGYYISINGFENNICYPGDEKAVTWNSHDAGDYVKIILFNNKNSYVIDEMTENDGIYVWKVSYDITEGFYSLQIESISEKLLYDRIEQINIKKPFIDLTLPTRLSIVQGESLHINWDSGKVGSYVDISLYTGETLIQKISSNEKNDGNYEWDTSTIPIGSYSILIESSGDKSLFDTISVSIEKSFIEQAVNIMIPISLIFTLIVSIVGINYILKNQKVKQSAIDSLEK